MDWLKKEIWVLQYFMPWVGVMEFKKKKRIYVKKQYRKYFCSYINKKTEYTGVLLTKILPQQKDFKEGLITQAIIVVYILVRKKSKI